MLIPHTSDTLHRAWLLRLISAIADNRFLASCLRFKGGTCAAMRNKLDRFSVDLDFDLLKKEDIPSARKHLEKIFSDLDLMIKDKSAVVPQYFLGYKNEKDKRNTIAIDITVPPPKTNEYELVRLPDIDRFVHCQTIATMVANKLVTPEDRFGKNGTIAGRDIYDIHHFLLHDLPVNEAVIEERTGKSYKNHLKSLYDFIDQRVTQTIIDQDLNTLLPPVYFQKIHKCLKTETLSFLLNL